MEITKIKINLLEMNTGQVEGLPTNPRSWTKTELENLKKSIIETPELFEARPILVTPTGGKYAILGGNMRYSASKALGLKDVPCIVFPEGTPIDKLKEIVIKDNGSFGDWDYDSLANEWGDLPLTEWGVPAWDTDSEKETAEVQEDDFDEETDAIEVRCKPGDIWQLGEHRLMCGDSIDLEQVKKLMGGAEADLLLTDPPYNVDYTGGTNEKLKIQNDKMSDSAFREFLKAAFSTADAVMKKGAAFYIWHADSEGFNFRGACKEAGWTIRECLIWKKNAMVLGRQDYQWKHEPCLYGWKEGASHHWYNDRSQTTILEFNKPLRNGEHPTMKPVELFAYQISNSSKRGDVVLDLFGGSGTTIIAAEQLGRKGYVMELDPHYCDVIIARWEKATGKMAERI